MHGGKSVSGPVSGTWKTGRWAMAMRNTKLRNHFYAALSDEALLKNQQDVALHDALVANLLDQLKPGRPITDREEYRLSKLVENRQKAVSLLVLTEQRLQLWIHFAKYRKVLDAIVAAIHEEYKLPDGQLNREALLRLQKRIDMATAEQNLIDGEVVEVDADGGPVE
jgi:hypothetical protein